MSVTSKSTFLKKKHAKIRIFDNSYLSLLDVCEVRGALQGSETNVLRSFLKVKALLSHHSTATILVEKRKKPPGPPPDESVRTLICWSSFLTEWLNVA